MNILPIIYLFLFGMIIVSSKKTVKENLRIICDSYARIDAIEKITTRNESDETTKYVVVIGKDLWMAKTLSNILATKRRSIDVFLRNSKRKLKGIDAIWKTEFNKSSECFSQFGSNWAYEVIIFSQNRSLY